MIINSSIGKGFSGALLYVYKSNVDLKDSERAEIIEKNNVYGESPKYIAMQMREQAEQSGRVQKPVIHLSFSFSEHDKITPQKEIEAIKTAMEHFGVTESKHQYVLVKHNDQESHNHNHYHAIINKVDNQNLSLNTDWLHNKCQGIADRVEQEHNLARTQRQRIYDKEKDEYRFTTKEEKAKIVKSKQTKVFKDKAPKLNEYQTKIQTGIRESLSNKEIKTFDDLKKDLDKNNIQAKLRLDDKTQEVKGISFRYDKKLSVKGGDVGYTSTLIANKLEENKAIQMQSTTIAPKAEPIKEATTKASQTKAQKQINDFKYIIEKHQLPKVEPKAEPIKEATTIAPKAEPTPKPIQKPMENDDREFTKEYNQRIENVVKAHNSAYDKGETPDTKAIFEQNGFKKENDMFVFSNDDHRQEISGASFDIISEKAEAYKKIQEQKPEKVPMFFGKAEAEKRNEALKTKQQRQANEKPPRLESQHFKRQSRTETVLEKKKEEAKLQQQKEERQAKQQTKSKGRNL